MTNTHLLIMVLVAGACTFATRLFPFALFGGKKQVPKFVQYLGNVLPVAILGILIVYCLKDFEQGNVNYIVPQLIAVALTAGMHLWRKNTLLSIAVRTIGYLLLILFLFISQKQKNTKMTAPGMVRSFFSLSVVFTPQRGQSGSHDPTLYGSDLN